LVLIHIPIGLVVLLGLLGVVVAVLFFIEVTSVRSSTLQKRDHDDAGGA
jgi:predicted Holliday junction resolvase-like endonuclease